MYLFCSMENKIKYSFRLLLPAFTLLFLSSLTFGQSLKSGKPYKGIASFYAKKFHGRLTANGETFDNTEFTCAHKTLPFGTILEVENIKNGKKVIVRVNDRGPYIAGREIDLSFKAAKSLGFIKKGVSKVNITIVNEDQPIGPVQDESLEPIEKPVFDKDTANIIYSLISEGSNKRRYIIKY